MGTPNFYYNDTLYTLDNTDNDLIYEDTKENIKNDLAQFDKLSHVKVSYDDNETYTDDNRSYGGVVVVECRADICIDNLLDDAKVEFTLTQDIILRSGYYSGFNLDRVISDDNEEYESLDGIASAIADDVRQYDELDIKLHFVDECIYDEYIDRHVKFELDTVIRDVMDEFDTVYHTLGKAYFTELSVVAQFSNGETIYTTGE